MTIQVLQKPLFERQKKKLSKRQINELDKAIKEIIKKPEISSEKKET